MSNIVIVGQKAKVLASRAPAAIGGGASITSNVIDVSNQTQLRVTFKLAAGGAAAAGYPRIVQSIDGVTNDIITEVPIDATQPVPVYTTTITLLLPYVKVEYTNGVGATTLSYYVVALPAVAGTPGAAGAAGPAGPPGPLATLYSYPATSGLVDVGGVPGSGGKVTPLVYPGIGQGQLSGFWQPAPGAGGLFASAIEADAGKQVSYVPCGFLDDSAGAATQYIDFFAAVPDGFTTFSGDFEALSKYVSDTGSGVDANMTLELFDPATGAVAATATRNAPAGGPFEAAYAALSIPQATLNGIGFVAGDLFHFRLSCPPVAVGGGDVRGVRFSRVSIPWA